MVMQKISTQKIRITASLSHRHHTHFQAITITLLYQPQFERGFKQQAGYIYQPRCTQTYVCYKASLELLCGTHSRSHSVTPSVKCLYMYVVATSAATNPLGSETWLTEYCGACKKNKNSVLHSFNARTDERRTHVHLLYKDTRRRRQSVGNCAVNVGSVAVFPWSPAWTLGVRPY